jgi:D-alanine-D-alanine ligase
MQRKLRVGVVFGGRSGEHEVSLASARSIMAVMNREKYDIVPIGITRDGRWLTSGDPMLALTDGAQAAPPPSAQDPAAGRELVPGTSGGRLPPLDVIFPVLHGPFGEDGTVQGLLELANVPYVGCGVLASSLAMDKIASKEIFIAHGIPVAPYRAVKRKRWEAEPTVVIAELEAHLGYPMFVKPANLGSSVGVGRAGDRAELEAGLAEAARYDRKLLIEAAVPNAREIECAVLGNDEPLASVPGEVVPSNEFYDYAAKYLDGRSESRIPAPITADQAAQVRKLAVQAFLALDAAGLSRVDFLLDDLSGKLYLNEVNTLPGFTSISMYPQLWAASGIPYSELIDRLVDLALERHADRERSQSVYTGATQL